MGNRGISISHYLVIIVSFAIFLIPVSQADAIFLVPIEISDKEFFKNYIEIQKLKQEKFRDYYFEEYLRLQNPYNDKTSDKVIIFNDHTFNLPKSIDRHDENFQMLKNNQIDLAQKKYFEIMGGKTITSSLDDKSEKRIIAILEFTEEEKNFMKTLHRESEDFKSYTIQQKILAENIVNRLISEGVWKEDPFVITELFEDNYYSDDSSRDVESIEAAFDLIEDEVVTAEELIENNVISSEDLIQDNVISANYLELFWKTYEPVKNKAEAIQETIVIPEKDDFDWNDYEWKNSNRASPEFQNLITEQMLLAEQLRDESVELSSHSITNEEKNVMVVTTNEFFELEPIVLREDKIFQEYKLKQIENAELMLSDYYHMKAIDEDEINDELIIEKEFRIPKVNDRNDLFFKLLMEFEKDKAERKILEILGGKKINN